MFQLNIWFWVLVELVRLQGRTFLLHQIPVVKKILYLEQNTDEQCQAKERLSALF